MGKILAPLLTTLLLSVILIVSCKSTNDKDGEASKTESGASDRTDIIKDDELKSFMLGGIYFIRGYNGQATFQSMLTSQGTDDKEIVDAAREYLIFPFKPADGPGAKSTLSSMWEINNKEDFLKTLTELKTHKMQSSFTKAWDYARYVNNVCMGYAAGYLTEDEGKKLVAEILPLAQKDYKTWSDYFTDFAVGRNKWDDKESADKKDFDELSKTITQGDNNIYSIIPLN